MSIAADLMGIAADALTLGAAADRAGATPDEVRRWADVADAFVALAARMDATASTPLGNLGETTTTEDKQ
jgi:hypothetical protein